MIPKKSLLSFIFLSTTFLQLIGLAAFTSINITKITDNSFYLLPILIFAKIIDPTGIGSIILFNLISSFYANFWAWFELIIYLFYIRNKIDFAANSLSKIFFIIKICIGVILLIFVIAVKGLLANEPDYNTDKIITSNQTSNLDLQTFSDNIISVMVDGYEREYIIKIPSSYKKDKVYPIVYVNSMRLYKSLGTYYQATTDDMEYEFIAVGFIQEALNSDTLIEIPKQKEFNYITAVQKDLERFGIENQNDKYLIIDGWNDPFIFELIDYYYNLDAYAFINSNIPSSSSKINFEGKNMLYLELLNTKKEPATFISKWAAQNGCKTPIKTTTENLSRNAMIHDYTNCSKNVTGKTYQITGGGNNSLQPIHKQLIFDFFGFSKTKIKVNL